MNSLLLRADDVLRRRQGAARAHGSDIATLAAIVFAFGLFYGAVMGSFGGALSPAALQMLYSALKVPLLLLATFVLSIPFFFVANSLLGLRRDFGDAVRAVLATQAGLAIILASLAPLTMLWYASSDQYEAAVAFNGLMFLVATFSAQWILRAYYRPLIERNPTHRWMLRTWVVVYSFVGIQMAWMLRPFIGDPDSPVQFFREESWGNAYVIVLRVVWQAISH
jgi:hypothetical protein